MESLYQRFERIKEEVTPEQFELILQEARQFRNVGPAAVDFIAEWDEVCIPSINYALHGIVEEDYNACTIITALAA